MKRATRPARRDHAIRQLATPIPAWDGNSATVKLSDWPAFAQVNQLRATRLFIAGESNGRLQVVVHVGAPAQDG